ncbi:hypothetical protein AVEN_54987-1 [Araneus ventricosus]|uniref:Reverse transcriptase domain-containing protein n=1 Tax=Araneus ventricosus TaxID=182803 RepID=A0A4Y2P6Y0_ARAVE|nr:hypothetical protein AVEN_54987-1 [Araneus ventricosus]
MSVTPMLPQPTEYWSYSPDLKKVENISDIKSYRRVTLLSTLGKILEKLLLERVNHHLRKNNHQHSNQYGFRTNRSTEETILDLLHKINSAENRNQHALMISLESKGKLAINTSQSPATWNQQQGCPQGSCTGSAFWNLVADEVLLQHWPQRVHLQAFADNFDFLANAGQNRKSKNWPIKHYKPSRPGLKSTNLKFYFTKLIISI